MVVKVEPFKIKKKIFHNFGEGETDEYFGIDLPDKVKTKGVLKYKTCVAKLNNQG